MNSEKNTVFGTLCVLLLLIALTANSESPAGSALKLTYGDYCRFVKGTEMGYKLEWGKNGIRNISSSTFDTSQILQCNLVMETNEFIVLKIIEGTGTRKSIILPLNRESPEIHYENALCIDPENTTIILENSARDSVFIVENFLTEKNVVLGKGFTPCRSGSPRDCLDSLFFNGNTLTFNWITPCKHCDNRKIEFKKFKINLQ